MRNASVPMEREYSKAFTLVEMIITMVMLSVLSLFALTFIYHAAQTYGAMNSRSRCYEEGKTAMERMVRELREASSIIYPPPGAGNADRVTIAISRAAGSEIVDFRLASGAIIRNDPKHPLASRVSTFSVARTSASDPIYGPNKLTLFMTLSADEQNVSVSMQVIPKNLPWLASRTSPKKRFRQDWWEIVER